MSETELRVVCKSCGAEVSPYVTECPYCGARVRKRAPKLERRDGALEAKKTRREKRRERQAAKALLNERTEARPWTTIAMILVPAIAILVRIASGGSIEGFGALIVPFDSEWWRFLTAPFAYESLGYLFAVSLAIVLFVPPLERRLGSIPVFILLLACGALGVLAAYGIENGRGVLDFIGGGNGIALGAIAAWFVVERHETGNFADEEDKPDMIGVLVCVAVIMLLPAVVGSANVFSAIAGGAVGALAGLAATLVKR